MSETLNEFGGGAVFVAGGSGGLGSAICQALSVRGVPVAIGYRSNEAAAAALAERLGDGQAMVVNCDLRDEATVDRALRATAERWVEIESVISAAGPKYEAEFFSRRPTAEWSSILSDDLLAAVTLFHAAIPHLRRSRGSAVAVTTYQADRLKLQGSWSSIPKAGVEMLIRCIAKEEGRYGVRANAVRAGFIDSGLGAARLADPGFREMIERESALGRPGSADEVAEAVLFLASRRASLITGAVLSADGGQSL